MEFNYRCSCCSATYEITPDLTVCSTCAQRQQSDQPLIGILEVELKGELNSPFNIGEMLPIEAEYFPPIPVGNTPLWEPVNVRKSTGLRKLYLKDDGVNPTFSLKDRASYLVSAAAKKFKITDITLASTGNAGSSMAGIGAAAGQRVTLFLPKTAPPAKLVQALQYGARVYRVDGNYDRAYDISLAFTEQFGGINRNTAYNPLTIEGKKTVSLEIYSQLGRAPDIIFVAVGDGCILAGVYKGFKDLLQLGLITTVPKIVGVQAETSNALHRAFKSGIFEAKPSTTVADSICVDVPRNGTHALSLLKTYEGEMISVSDEQILQAQAHLSSTAGLFTEPAGAASFAGFMKCASQLDPDDMVVVLTTGNGLKDSTSAGRVVEISEHLITCVDDII